MLGFGSLYGGPEWAYWNAGKDFVSAANDDVVLAAYNKVTEPVEGAEGEEPTTTTSFVLIEDNEATSSNEAVQFDNGTSATGVKYTTTQTVNILSDAEMNETYGIVKNEDGSYTFGETAYNNFLGLSLPGAYGNYYYPGKDEKSIENVQDEEGNWYHRAYGEYYITGLRVYDAEYKFAAITCIDGAKETVVNTIPGDAIKYPEVGTSFNGDKMWSLAADKYVPVPTVATAEDITVYAYVNPVVGFENYNTSNEFVHNAWLTNAMISDEKVYAGEKAIKYHNINLTNIKTEPADWASAWTKYYSYDAENDVFELLGGEAAPAFEVGKYYSARPSNSVEQGAFIVADLGPTSIDGAANVFNYTKRLSFKYFVPEGNTMDFAGSAIQFNKGNLWWGSAQVGAPVAIDGTPTGEWKTFEMLISAKDLEAAGNKGSGKQVVAVKVSTATVTGANARNATIYIDDVTVDDFVVDNQVVYHYNDGVTADETITEGLETGVAYKIDRMATAPEGKYFAGWYTDEALTVPAGTEVMAPISGTINLYAKYNDYVGSATFNYKNADVKDVKDVFFMKDGVYKNTVAESGWQTFKYTADGVYMAKADGNCYTFNPTKTDGLAQRTATLIKQGYSFLGAKDAVGSTKYADIAVGEETVIGWGALTGFVIKDADGTAFVPKSNTQYKVSVKLNVVSAGPANSVINIVSGRKMANTEKGANDISASVYGIGVSNSYTIKEAGEQIAEFTINTKDLSEVPALLSVHASINGFKAKKVAEANGVDKYTLDDGSTVYPFEVTDKAEFYVEEVVVTEMDSSVTFVNGDKENVVLGVKGDAVDYPALPANRNYDYVWSLEADKYVPAPEKFDGAVTVYAYQNTVIGLENYSGHAYDGGVNISVSDEKAYSGNKSFRYEDIDYAPITADKALKEKVEGDPTSVAWLDSTDQFFWKNMLVFDEETESYVKVTGDEAPEFEEGKYFRLRNNNKDHAIALWKLEKNKAYKVTYKYYVEKASADINVTAVMSKNANIWTPTAINAGTAVISKDSAVGEWLDGEIYLNNVSDNTELYMLFSNPGVATGDVLYFDDFAVEEVQVVSFVIPEGFTAEVYEGTLKDGVITTYLAMGEEIPVPVVVDADGNVVELWVDADGKQVTEFVSGGVYTAYVAPAFIYGDCNGDGEINTTDLAALKLKLAGSGEVGPGADCNGDGEINTTDLAVLKLNLAGSGVLGPQE